LVGKTGSHIPRPPAKERGKDACTRKGEDFGEDRLIEVVRKNRKLAPELLLSAVVDEIRRFGPNEQYDDITMIVAKCRGVSH
jgi:serine phosphatase RsbU (regulator of sigma subunit)